MGLCAIASKSLPAQAGATLLAGPAHGQGWLSKPGCCRGSGQVIRWRAALGSAHTIGVVALRRNPKGRGQFSRFRCRSSLQWPTTARSSLLELGKTGSRRRHPNSVNRPLRQQGSRAPREGIGFFPGSMRRDAIHGCGSTLFLPYRLPTETNCRRNQEPQGGGYSPSPGALLPLFLRLSIRLSNWGVITCKVQRGSNRLKNHRFMGGGEAPDA